MSTATSIEPASARQHRDPIPARGAGPVKRESGPRAKLGPLPAKRAEDQARQGRRERSVLCTRASEDAAEPGDTRSARIPEPASAGPRFALPAVVREGLVGLGHAVDVVLA